MKIKIIFLDVDGVLVNRNSLRYASGLMAKGDPVCVQNLNQIISKTGAVIVVSSTWRMAGETKIREILREWGVRARILGVTPFLAGIGLTRGHEIAASLDHFKKEFDIETYIIIDDDNDSNWDVSRLIKTQSEIGLTETDAAKAIELLNS